MRKKNVISLLILILIMIAFSINSYAGTDDIQNDKLRVIFNPKIDSTNTKTRQEEYNNIIELSDEDMDEVLRDPVDIDYSGISLYDDSPNDFDYFDINGFVNGEWKSTTYRDIGYFTAIKVNENSPKLLKFDKSVVYNIQSDINCEFVYDGGLVRVKYSLKNIGEEPATISLGSFADIQIGGNDCARVERIDDSAGIKMYDPTENLQFAFYGKNNEYVTDIDRLWIGLFPEEEFHFFNQNKINVIEKNDTSFTYSWIDRVIQPGETKEFSVLLGIGKFTSVPVCEFDAEQGDQFDKTDVVINVDVKDGDEDSSAELHYILDDSDSEEIIDSKNLVDGKVRIPIDLTQRNLSVGKHHIKVWAIDNQGNRSNTIEKDFYISTLKPPILEMSEEWSKNDVTFKVLDTENDQEKVLKYQYSINEGEWKDTELNKVEVALTQSGTAKVQVRVLGKTDNDIGISEVKTAKVDKKSPIENELLFADNKFSFSAKDEHSGVKKFMYEWSESADINVEDSETLDDFTLFDKPFEFTSNSTKDLYLHFGTFDMVDNVAYTTVKFSYPKAPKIEVEKTFKDVTPVFRITDSQESDKFPFTYEMQINDGEWQTARPGQNYDVVKVLEGKNTIKVRKKDVLGRVSEASAEFKYEKTKQEDPPTPTPTPTPEPKKEEQNTNPQPTIIEPTTSEQKPAQNTTPNATVVTTDSKQTYATPSSNNDTTVANKAIPKAGLGVFWKVVCTISICVVFVSSFMLKKYKF